MVRNYCKIIELTGADPDKVLGTVRGYLFSQPYTKQKDGLVEALLKGMAQKNDGSKMKLTEIRKVVQLCVEYDFSEKWFEEKLQALLVTG